MTGNQGDRKDFGDLLENFNRAMIEVDPKSVQLDAPPSLRDAFPVYHAALRRLYA